jgi:uncharacterized protein YndB with AHSA1/START domain
MKDNIHHQFFFPHPPEMVWEYLTKAELIEQWLMKNDFQPVVGHAFQFRINPVASIEFDGIIYCTVLEIVPFKKLSYSWKSGPGQGKITLDSTVVWTLHAKEAGTELQLEHSGFTGNEVPLLYQMLMNGWLENIQKMANRIKANKNDTTNP